MHQGIPQKKKTIRYIGVVVDKYELFKLHVKESAERFLQVDKLQTLRLISHLDADGISAASLMTRWFNKDNRKYSLSIVQQLNKEVISSLARETYRYFVFTDLGSGQLGFIKEFLSDRHVLILDHHEPEDIQLPENFIQVNPHLFGIDGSREISGAGVVYLFVSSINEQMKDLAHVPIIGAIGDVQENHGFTKLNKEILDEAVKRGKIKVITGLRLFGAQTRPLHKVLEYSTTPYIPGVSGTESGAIQFLQQIGVNPRTEKGWRKIVHLSDEELQKLSTGIVMRRLGEEKPEDIIGNVYILPEEAKESPTRDAKEFATLLNACGRLGKASLGIGTCLGDKKIKEKAIRSLLQYKKEIVNAIKWYERSQETDRVIKGEGFTIFNAKDNILPTIVGTLASIVAKSNSIGKRTYILGIADLLNGTCKASMRVAGQARDVDLYALIKEIADKVPGVEAGGHSSAAGAMVPADKENLFIEAATEVLSRRSLEEKII
ncbi:MAG TPA: DHH family phosphoesterase [Candidatus Nanoarchaeia archaeon]|nr:DHH family phosphoesterase [Candidatus Nanoarchaeia archaeon]